jgi:hypothetical protein
MAGSLIHFIGGGTLDVAQDPNDAARTLWSPQGRSDADSDMGYAVLDVKGKSKYVNPRAVAWVEEGRGQRAHRDDVQT